MCKHVENSFREKHFIQLAGKDIKFRNWSGKIPSFQNISKWVYTTSFPFHPDPLPVGVLEEGSAFLRTTALTNPIALRHMPEGEGEGGRLK